MEHKIISYRDEAGNLISAADIWTVEKLEELFTQLNPKRLERRSGLMKEELAVRHSSKNRVICGKIERLERQGIRE